jgi:hypothetical protein
MVTLEFFFPHNVTTWAHFFHKKPVVPLHQPFFFFWLAKNSARGKTTIVSWIKNVICFIKSYELVKLEVIQG